MSLELAYALISLEQMVHQSLSELLLYLTCIFQNSSPLRDENVTSPDPISVSGLTTGFFFTVSGSNLGSGVTSLNMAGSYVGVGTTALDNIYEVSHHVGVTTVGFGSDQAETLTRVFCRVLRLEWIAEYSWLFYIKSRSINIIRR